MKFDLFERIDVALHWAMRSSYKNYRKTMQRLLIDSQTLPSTFDNWYCNRLYQVYSFFKKAWNGHVRKPSEGHALFLVTMDEVFSNAKVLIVLFPFIRVRVGLKDNA